MRVVTEKALNGASVGWYVVDETGRKRFGPYVWLWQARQAMDHMRK